MIVNKKNNCKKEMIIPFCILYKKKKSLDDTRGNGNNYKYIK